MKKIIIGIILLLTMSLSAMVWRFDDFETGAFGDIIVHDQDGDGQNWEVVSSVRGKAGNYHARSASAGLTPDNQMDFPVVYVEAESTYLTFWVGAESETNFAETYQVYLDFNGPCQPDMSELIWEETLTSSEWKQVSIHISPYIYALNEYAWDDDIYISLRHSGSSDQSALLMDDIMFLSRPSYLLDEGWHLTPEGVFEPYQDIDMVWSPWDLSGWDETDWSFIGYKSVELHYILTDDQGSQPIQTIEMTINPDPNYEGSYVVTLPGQPMGTFVEYWAVTTDNSGFDITGESEHYFLEWGEITYEEGFEAYDSTDGWLPEGWVTFQLGDNQGSSWDAPWEVDVPGQNIRSGNYSITSASQNNFGVWLTENYLVSPRKRINAKDTYLKYFVNAQTIAGENYRERWSLLISTVDGDGTDIENFTEVARDSIIPTNDNLDTWYEKVLDLGPYENEQIRIMWKHHFTSTDSKLDRFLNIDDISIAEMPVITIHDAGNAAMPGEDVSVTATATDYSGIDNVTLYYTVQGSVEVSVVMTDNGDDTFSGIIPGQAADAKCSWYAVVTDASPSANSVTTESYDIIWFDSGILEWGSEGTAYSDYPEPFNAGNKAGMDWNFGTKGNLYLNQIEIGIDRDFSGLKWKLVEFDGEPTENIIEDLSGTWDYTTDQRTVLLDGNNTPISGHVALVFEFDKFCNIMLDEGGNKSHAWQWNNVTGWSTNDWGAFYIKMYVSQTVGSENEIIAAQTELYQNYPNPFNPVTGISFYNSLAGDVNLSIYNVKGEMVANLVDHRMESGFNKVDFNASMLNSGVYYYTLKTPEAIITKKMVLIK